MVFAFYSLERKGLEWYAMNEFVVGIVCGIGAAALIGVAVSVRGWPWRKWMRQTDNEDLMAFAGLAVILGRSLLLTDGQWIDLINGGQFVWLFIAVAGSTSLPKLARRSTDSS